MDVEETVKEKVKKGFEHIAYGEVSDPVRLLFCEDVTPRTLKSMDLFCVSEIKRPKGGGMEIKFYDRMRAMQCLLEMNAAGDEAGSFYKALEQGAKSLSGDEDP